MAIEIVEMFQKNVQILLITYTFTYLLTVNVYTLISDYKKGHILDKTVFYV